MFRKIDLPSQQFESYTQLLEPQLVDQLRSLAQNLHGRHLVHLSSTATGGGVAEILRSLVPLMRGLGLEAEWYVLTPPPSFFLITKKIHHLLQGMEGSLSQEELDSYVGCLKEAASSLEMAGLKADVWFLHDPQLLPLARYLSKRSNGIYLWVCHIDMSTPNLGVLEMLLPLASSYHGLIFTMEAYIPAGLNNGKVRVIPPAIDPLSVKNSALSPDEAWELVAGLGIDPVRPLVTQVSRFDIWKDPLGVIDAFRAARVTIPGLQLALLGLARPSDDPDFTAVLQGVQRHANGDPDIHILWDADGVRDVDRTVNAFQTVSNVVLQKSLREGFGLTVSEAMWKGTPVVGGNVGGIRLQIEDRVNGFLVNSPDECAQRIVQLVQDPPLRQAMGQQAHQKAGQHYLLPRLVRDYLQAAQDFLHPSARSRKHRIAHALEA
ncbi:MAG: glycosyltransferase [Dehalococcoidia bacterium]